ncbi:MAG: methyltransferase domain-containing protein [Aggregatilineales bacterium]
MPIDKTDKIQTEPLVNLLTERGKLQDSRIEAAFAEVPRHIFIPQADPQDVYTDTSIVIEYDENNEAVISSIMPSMLAQMLHQLDLSSGQNVLEIGTGTGYFAALLRHVLGADSTVTSIEIDREMTHAAEKNLLKLGFRNINIVNGDGASGYAPRAAYDRIVSTVGVWDIPPAWIRQLKPNGRLVVPVWLDGLQVIATFVKESDDVLYSEWNTSGAFVYMRGMAAGPQVNKRIGSTSLSLLADDIRSIDSAALNALLLEDFDLCQLTIPLASEEYWYGCLPYIMLHEPEHYIFALYEVRGDQQAYGMGGEGFALFTAGSACFVPYFGLGGTHCFAGADAFLMVEELVNNWQEQGRPGIDRLRLRLIPRGETRPEISTGKLYERKEHYLHVWFDDLDSPEISKQA